MSVLTELEICSKSAFFPFFVGPLFDQAEEWEERQDFLLDISGAEK